MGLLQLRPRWRHAKAAIEAHGPSIEGEPVLVHEIQSCAVDAEEASLRASGESDANQWIAWARREGHDDYWTYGPRFQCDVVLVHSGFALEVGGGEGGVSGDLEGTGLDVIPIEAFQTVLAAAA